MYWFKHPTLALPVVAVMAGLVIICIAGQALVHAEPSADLIVTEFRQLSELGWSFWPGAEFPGAAGRVEIVRDERREREELHLHYDFSHGGAYVGARGTFPLSDRMRSLVLEVDAEAGFRLAVRFFDRTGQVFQKSQPVEGAGRQTVTVEVSPPWVVIFGGAGDQQIHWPIRTVLLSVERGNVAQGVVKFTDLQARCLPAAPGQLSWAQRDREQKAFKSRLREWRQQWLDLLDRAAALEEWLDRSLRLKSYGQRVRATFRYRLRQQTEALWEQLDSIGKAWDEVVNEYNLIETDQQLREAAAKAAGVEAQLAVAAGNAEAAFEQDLREPGADWLRVREPSVSQWTAGSHPKKGFADHWQHVISHAPGSYLTDQLVRPSDFPARGGSEILYIGLTPDGELDDEEMAQVDAAIQQCADLGFQAMPSYFDYGLYSANGVPLTKWFRERHGVENAVLRPYPNDEIGGVANYWYPPTRDLIVNYVAKSAAHFNGDSRVLGFEFYNEPMMYQLHEVYQDKWVRKAYLAWLQERYGTVAALNRCWGTTYQSFEQVETPPGFRVLGYDSSRQEMARTFDFRLFLRESYADLFRGCVNAFHENNTTHPIIPQFNSYFNFHQDNLLDTFLDESVGWDVISYHEAGGSVDYYAGGWGFGELNYTASHAAILEKPSFADEYIWAYTETQLATKLYGGVQPTDVVRRGARRNLWEQLAWGKCGVEVFSLGISGWSNTLLTPSQQRLAPQAGVFQRMRRTAEQVREVTKHTNVVFAPVALLEPIDATYMSCPSEVPLSEARAFNHFCYTRHVPVFYLPERALSGGQASLDDFRVVVAPYCYLLSRPVAEKLARWVEAGGYLIASGPIGLKDGYGRPGGPLLDRLPHNASLQPPDPEQPASMLQLGQGVEIDLNPWKHILWRGDGTALPEGTKALLRTADGRPLVTETACGQGWIVQSLVPLGMISTTLGGAEEHFQQGYPEARIPLGKPEEALQKTLWSLLARHGDPRPVRTVAPQVTVLRHQGGKGQEYLFAVNLNPLRPATVTLDIPEKFTACEDVILNGCPVPVEVVDGATRLSLKLAAGDGTLLRLSR